MAANLTRLNVALTLTTAAFTRSAKAAATGMVATANVISKSVSAIKNSDAFDSLGRQMTRLVNGPMAALTGALSAGAIAYGVQRTAQSIDQLAKSADMLGVSINSLVSLRYLSQQAGMEVNALEKAMVRLQTKATEASFGVEDAEKALRTFGLEAHTLLGMTADKQLEALADSMKNMGTSAEKNSALVKLFGEEGAKIGKVLAGGSEAIDAARKKTDELGASMSRLDAARVEDMNKAYNDATISISSALKNLTIEIAPVATGFINMFNDATKGSNGFKDSMKKVMDIAVSVGGFLADTWQVLEVGFQAGRVGASALALGLTYVADSAIRAAEWIGTKFKQAWDVVTTSFDVMKKALAIGWEALKIPLAKFVEYTVEQLATMLGKSGELLNDVNKNLGWGMMRTAEKMSQSVAGMGKKAEEDFNKASEEGKKAADASGAAWSALFSEVKTEGNEFVNGLLGEYTRLFGEETTLLENMINAPWYSEGLNQLVAKFRAAADAKDVIRRDDQAKEKSATDAALAEAERLAKGRKQIRDMEAIGKKAERDIDELIAENAKKMRESEEIERIKSQGGFLFQMGNTFGAFNGMQLEALRKQQGIWGVWDSQFSQFLGHLSTLQQSHDKRVRAIGKVAAKAQIVASTATAAMNSIASLSTFGPWGIAAGYAAAAAAVAAGAIQLANVDGGRIGMSGGGASVVDSASTSSINESRGPTQTLVVQGDYLTPETLARLFSEAKEKGITIEGVRRA